MEISVFPNADHKQSNHLMTNIWTFYKTRTAAMERWFDAVFRTAYDFLSKSRNRMIR